MWPLWVTVTFNIVCIYPIKKYDMSLNDHFTNDKHGWAHIDVHTRQHTVGWSFFRSESDDFVQFSSEKSQLIPIKLIQLGTNRRIPPKWTWRLPQFPKNSIFGRWINTELAFCLRNRKKMMIDKHRVEWTERIAIKPIAVSYHQYIKVCSNICTPLFH